MAGALVPGAAALEVVAPGDRVVGTHRAVARVVRRLVQGEQDVHVLARVGGEVVPLVEAHPLLRQHLRRRVRRALHAHGRGLLGRVVAEAGAAAGQLAVPRHGVHRVGRGVQADVAAARADVALERRELGVVEQARARRVEVVRGVDRRCEQDGGVLTEALRRGERRRGQRERGLHRVPHVDGEAVLLAELDDRVGRVVDVGVAEAERLADDQHLVGLCGRGGAGGRDRSVGSGGGVAGPGQEQGAGGEAGGEQAERFPHESSFG